MSKQIINKNNYLNITPKPFYIKTADENCHIVKVLERQVATRLGGEEVLGLIAVGITPNIFIHVISSETLNQSACSD